jgi:hypothetical protein
MKAKIIHPMDKTPPTNITHFVGANGDKLEVHVWNTLDGFRWRLVVNGDIGNSTSYYDGVYCHKGWHLATAYWGGTFSEFVPFQISEAKAK